MNAGWGSSGRAPSGAAPKGDGEGAVHEQQHADPVPHLKSGAIATDHSRLGPRRHAHSIKRNVPTPTNKSPVPVPCPAPRGPVYRPREHALTPCTLHANSVCAASRSACTYRLEHGASVACFVCIRASVPKCRIACRVSVPHRAFTSVLATSRIARPCCIAYR
jgi:hypothetical protein